MSKKKNYKDSLVEVYKQEGYNLAWDKNSKTLVSEIAAGIGIDTKAEIDHIEHGRYQVEYKDGKLHFRLVIYRAKVFDFEEVKERGLRIELREKPVDSLESEEESKEIEEPKEEKTAPPKKQANTPPKDALHVMSKKPLKVVWDPKEEKFYVRNNGIGDNTGTGKVVVKDKEAGNYQIKFANKNGAVALEFENHKPKFATRALIMNPTKIEREMIMNHVFNSDIAANQIYNIPMHDISVSSHAIERIKERFPDVLSKAALEHPKLAAGEAKAGVAKEIYSAKNHSFMVGFRGSIVLLVGETRHIVMSENYKNGGRSLVIKTVVDRSDAVVNLREG